MINTALQGEDENELRDVFRSDFNSQAMLNPQQKYKVRTLLEDLPNDLRPSHIETEVGQDPADVIGDAQIT